MATPNQGISIFARILAAFLLVNIVSCSVLIFLAYGFSRHLVQKRTKENIEQQLTIIHDNFNYEFPIDMRRSINSLASSSTLDEYLLVSKAEKSIVGKKYEKIFRQMLKDHSSYHSIAFVDSDGEVQIEVVGNRRSRKNFDLKSPSLDASSPFLTAAAELFDILESTPLLLSSGNMEWFMPPREMQIRGPFIDEEGMVSFVAAIAKIDLDIGDFGGVVMIRQHLMDFFKDLRAVTVFDENLVWVFGAHGQVLQQPQNSAVAFDPTPYMSPTFQGSVRIDDVDDGIIAYQDFSVVPGQPLVRIAIGIPAALMFKDFKPAIRFFSLVLLGSIGIVLLVSLYVSRYLSKPIVELADASVCLAEGDLGARVRMRTTGEVQVLIDNFNCMSEKLLDSIDSRDQAVESLVNEVAERKRTQSELLRQAEQLTHARIAAESAARTKSQFLASMSHEIRTPINGVVGMAELLANSGLNEKQRRFAHVILRSGQSLLGVINDILDLSKIEAQKLELDNSPFDLRWLVEDVAEQLGIMAHQNGLELVCDVSLDLHGAVHGDAQRLRQVLVNLIGNAIKFTERGQVLVRVHPMADSTRAKQLPVRFEVIDTGIGIDADAQRQIFDSFTQADGSTSRQFGGTGLGLTISQNLVRLMQGEIGVESALGDGSTFWFTAIFDHAPAKEGAAAKDSILLRTLVLDDNDDSRMILARQLEAWKIEHARVADGRGALALLRQAAAMGEPFSVVLVDRFMPSMDGMEFARRVREDAALAATQLVLLSPVTEDGVAGTWRAPAFVDVLTKPLRQSDLYECLRSVCGGSGPCASDGGDWSDEREGPNCGAPNSRDAMPRTRFTAKILVAEDNAVNQELIREILVQLGCQVTLVEDGGAAVEAIKSESFDLVFMDCQMPGVDGFDGTTAIRVHENEGGKKHQTPIVALTANAMDGDRDRCLEAGMDDYLAKPFMCADLVAMLSRWLPNESLNEFDDRDEPAASSSDCPTDNPAAIKRDVDPAALKRIRDMAGPQGKELLIRVVERYLKETPILLGELAAAARAADYKTVGNVSHSIKSSSAYLGALSFSELCRAVEAACRSGQLAGIDARLEEMIADYEHVASALRSELDGIETDLEMRQCVV